MAVTVLPATKLLRFYGMVAAMFLGQLVFVSAAEEFEVRGDVSFERFSRGKSTHRVVRRFTFEARDGGWLLTTVPEQISSNAVFVSIGSAGGNQMSEVISNSLSHGRVATVLPGVIPEVSSMPLTCKYVDYEMKLTQQLNQFEKEAYAISNIMPPLYLNNHTYD